MDLPSPDTILEGDFWPEPVRVLRASHLGGRISLQAVGVQTGQLYQRLLSPADLQRIQQRRAAALDFSGSGEAFFLGIEAHRIRYAFQFDPLCAVNVSQVDALPHQIEAV